MLGLSMIVAAAAAFSLSGLPTWLAPRRSGRGHAAAAAMMVAGGALGLYGVALALGAPEPLTVRVPWDLPWGRSSVRLDALAAAFLVPVLVVPPLAAVYGLGYRNPAEHPRGGRRLATFSGLLAGAMVLVTIAGDALLFLIAWETMALAAYFAATTEEDDPAVRRSGWVYLVATHAGTLCLLAMFGLWRQATDSFALAPAALPENVASVAFVLALVGFGFKAGLVPFHVWLPGAHANAPSHVSAVMSGVMLKMGVYGIARMSGLLADGPAWWGATLLAVGALSGVLGIAFAIAQSDVKRVLAYSSVENVGIITIGLGLALLGRSLDRPEIVWLGLAGALFHVWNHALFKPLLFFGAGAVIHATGTRRIDRLGGLAKRMPWTAALATVGALAITGLPPLNGFAGEWLLYVGAFRTLGIAGGHSAAASVAVALALIGALAVACFVRLIGATFLGATRSDSAASAHDPGASMIGPMALLAAACVGLGLFPTVAARFLERAAGAWLGAGGSVLGSLVMLADLDRISALALGLVVLVAVIALAASRARRVPVRRSLTWDCGYAAPSPRMQYTASSFAETLVGLFAFALLPKTRSPALRGFFPRNARAATSMPDPFLDRLVLPLFRSAGRHLPRLRILQQGQTQWYVLYVLVTMIMLLAWASGSRP